MEHHHYQNITSVMLEAQEKPSSYFFEDHSRIILLHALFMSVASLLFMPAGKYQISTISCVALLMRRSKHYVMYHLGWWSLSMFGVCFAGIHYQVSTDLYENALHRRMGFVLLIGQTILFIVKARQYFRRTSEDNDPERGQFSRLSQHENVTSTSEDSMRSCETLYRNAGETRIDSPDEDNEVEKQVRDETSYKNFLVLSAIAVAFVLWYAQILTGIATLCGLFKGHEIFNGVAHWAKASVFLLFGIWVFVRYLGGFAKQGHAWNDHSSRTLSAEMIECGLICFYGCTNLFLERLGHTQDALSHTDIQHMSIALLFAVGGGIGILLEVRALQTLLFDRHVKMYNIMPPLVIFFTGILMSQHHQDSQFATTIHAMWGYFFCVASVLRVLTYILMFVQPPSPEPKRPPTEALVSFALIAGAIVFMLSARDVVTTLEHYSVSLMFVVSISVAGSLIIMAWTMYALVLRSLDVRS